MLAQPFQPQLLLPCGSLSFSWLPPPDNQKGGGLL